MLYTISSNIVSIVRSCFSHKPRLFLLGICLSCMTACSTPKVLSENIGTPGNAADFPVTIKHKYGETIIKKVPQRVVVIGYNDEQYPLAVDTIPVGVVNQYPGSYHTWPWTVKAWGTAQPVQVGSNPESTLDIEKIAALHPDVILGSSFDMSSSQYHILSKIAPTIAEISNTAPYAMTMDQLGDSISTALGKKAHMQQLLNAIKDKFKKIRESHPQFTHKVILPVTYYQGTFSIYTSYTAVGRTLRNLGFSSSQQVDTDAKGTYFDDLSSERIDTLDTDVLLIIANDADRTEIKKVPGFSRLNVVKKNHVIWIDDDQGDKLGAALYQSTPLSLPYAIDGLVKAYDTQYKNS